MNSIGSPVEVMDGHVGQANPTTSLTTKQLQSSSSPVQVVDGYVRQGSHCFNNQTDMENEMHELTGPGGRWARGSGCRTGR